MDAASDVLGRTRHMDTDGAGNARRTRRMRRRLMMALRVQRLVVVPARLSQAVSDVAGARRLPASGLGCGATGCRPNPTRDDQRRVSTASVASGVSAMAEFGLGSRYRFVL